MFFWAAGRNCVTEMYILICFYFPSYVYRKALWVWCKCVVQIYLTYLLKCKGAKVTHTACVKLSILNRLSMLMLKWLKINNVELALCTAKKFCSVIFKSKANDKHLRKVYAPQNCTVIAIPELFPHLKLSQRTMVDGKLVDGVWVFTVARV